MREQQPKRKKRWKEQLRDNMPAVFRSTFKGRPVVLTLDCLHWELENPSDTQAAKVTFSHYWNSSCGIAAGFTGRPPTSGSSTRRHGFL